MRKIFTLILIIVASCFFKPVTANAQVKVQDSLALIDLFNSTNGAHWWNRDGWTGKSPVSTWYGVTVTGNRVTDLNLRVNGLTGTIPSSIGNLTALKNLDFYDNQLTGSIPASMGNLINLESLDLEFNNLSGDISTFNNLTKLSFLDLNACHLTGSISFLAKLPNPQSIYLGGNQLSGKIPVINCANLAVLELSFNQLSGSIPTFKKDTANLYGEYGVTIRLDHNNLSGNINKFDNIVHLAELVLNNNQLTGRIPASLNKLVNLTTLDLSYNNFSGKLPSLDSLNQITYLNIGNNQFTFNGMEDLASHFHGASYSPQANIAINQNGNVLSVQAGGTISNNTYKWYKDGILFKTKKGHPGLSVTAPGNYSVTVTNSIATALTLYSDTIHYIMAPNSITAQAANENKILKAEVYPNPSTTNATVSFYADGKYTITVTDVSGKILQIKNGIAIKGMNSIQLDVNKYPGGIYLITIIDERNNKQSIQLNKQ